MQSCFSLVPSAPRKRFSYTKRILWNLMKLQNLLLLHKHNIKLIKPQPNLLSPRRRSKTLKLKDKILISLQRMSKSKLRTTAQRKTVWLFQLRPSRSQKALTKLKNLKQWKRLLRKLLKKLINKELN